MREALRLARAGEKEQARQLLIELLRQDRNNFDAWIIMAQVTGDRKEAITSMKQALRLRPTDERAQRYLEFLLQDEQQPNRPPVSTSPWLWGGLSAIAIICLAAGLILFLSRPGLQTQTSSTQQGSGPSTDCATLISQALEVSDQGCQGVGRDEVCYGHDTVQVQLSPGTNPPFKQPGNTIPVDILERFAASPLDTQKGDWGVGVFRLEANLPGTLPGQLVTMLVFGDTSLQNTSGDMQAFYFTSGLGGIKCDTVSFDGILVKMREDAGFTFKANGTGIVLKGSSLLQAIPYDRLVVTTLSGTGIVSAFGQEQALAPGQKVIVPMGGSNGLDASGPPDPPQPADAQAATAGCALTGLGCPTGVEVAGQAPASTPVPVDPNIPKSAPVPIDPSVPTNTPVPVAPGQPTNTSVPLPTNTPPPLPINTSAPVANTTTGSGSGSAATSTPKPGVANTTQPVMKTPTSTSLPAATTPPPTTPPPTTPPPTTPPPTTPPPTTPPPTTPPPTTPPPTTPPPTVDVCSTITLGAITVTSNNKAVSVSISSTGVTLTGIQIAWPIGTNGNLDKIKHGGFISGTSASSSPATFSVSEVIGTSDSLEFWFANKGVASTGYSITLTFAGGCTKQVTN